MPASMISEPGTGSENVSGNNRLIVARGPNPGRSPTSIPMTHPVAQYNRLCNVNACSKPNARLLMMSMPMLSVQRKLDAEKLLHREGDEAERAGDRGGARYREVVAGERHHRRHHDDPGKHVHVFGDECEAEEACGDERDVPKMEIERHRLQETRTHDNHDGDEEEEARDH